jgi:gliding motility-associated-like protein
VLIKTTKPDLNRILIILFTLVLSLNVKGQEYIGSDTLNTYYKVSAVNASSVICAGEDLSDLSPGDKVLMIQMTGGEFSAPFNVDAVNNIDAGAGAAGKYEFLSVLDANNSTKVVSFTAVLKNTYSASEKIQLVKVYEATSATVSSTLSAPAWDGDRGGILAMVILEKLSLNANIDVSAKGFRGADPLNFSLVCRPSIASDTFYFVAGSVNKGGLKGEGLVSTSFIYTIGPGNSITGGGGGAGKFGGGGGGSNYRSGGTGGQQIPSCPSSFTQFAIGGYEIASIWHKPIYNFQRITFGGGGGGSTEDGIYTATKGGNGGGIVFILADTLEGNGNLIISKGDSVTGIASAGAGGGGAGGTVLLDVTSYSGNLGINIAGGKGGRVDANCGGAGGGGSGGVFWQNKSSLPINITSIDTSKGSAGNRPLACPSSSQNAGGNGSMFNNLLPVLNGFTFNAIFGTDTICTGQIPDEIIGTTPKGDPNPGYQWLQSNDNKNWTVIGGATSKNYQPLALIDTTYYRRVVTFTGPPVIRDTSMSVHIMVYPEISNNVLNLRDTVCRAVVPGVLSAQVVAGGDGSNYSYQWESSTDQLSWTPRGNSATDSLNETNPLLATTYYRRQVESGPNGVCSSLSNIDTISVLDAISNNVFENPYIDTIICNGLQAGNILGSQPGGGEAGDYRYSWLSSANNLTYTPVPVENGKNFNPNTLTNTTYYKRIVYSGSNDACIDTTTTPRKVTVLTTLTNNIIDTDSSRYCSGDSPLELKQKVGFTLAGGDGSFDYQWQEYNGASWVNITGEKSTNFLPGVLTDSSTYRRVVSSGLVLPSSVFACVDQSNSLDIDVIPVINNTLISSDENICQVTQPLSFSEGPASGGAGAGTYVYLWEQNQASAGWNPASGTNNLASYAAPVLNASTLYRRVVNSQICSQTSNNISIVVYDSIRANTIFGPPIKYTCYNTAKLLSASVPQGGSGSYDYIWQASNDGNSWSDAGSSDQNFLSSVLTVPQYFRRIVHSGETAQCKDTSKIVLTEINPLPTGDILSAIDTICAGDIIEVNYENLTGNGPWSIALGETDVLHTETGISTTSGTISFSLNETADIIALTIQDDSLCYADISVNTGVFNATVYEVPVASAGDDFETCGLTTKLNATLSTPGVGLWESANANFVDPTLPNTTVTMDSYGLKSYTWTETNWECVDEDFVEVTFYEQPQEAVAGEDIALAYTFVTQLDANEPNDPASGAWQFISGNGVFADSTQAKTEVELNELGNYLLKWTIVNGVCLPVADSLSIRVNDLQLNNAFSPNNDRINDEYELDFPSGNMVKFTILDRNGSVVQIISGQFHIVWDGTNESGRQVPEDTYFYIIEEEGRPARNGFIEIRR